MKFLRNVVGYTLTNQTKNTVAITGFLYILKNTTFQKLGLFLPSSEEERDICSVQYVKKSYPQSLDK
jgi:hypothetical protein